MLELVLELLGAFTCTGLSVSVPGAISAAHFWNLFCMSAAVNVAARTETEDKWPEYQPAARRHCGLCVLGFSTLALLSLPFKNKIIENVLVFFQSGDAVLPVLS